MTDTDRLQHYRKHIRHLGEVIDEASAFRDVAIFRAHQLGLSTEQIARLTSLDTAEVHEVITDLGREPDIDQCGDGPRWLRCYPKAYP